MPKSRQVGPGFNPTNYTLSLHTGPPIFPAIENFQNGGWKITNDHNKVVFSAMISPPDPVYPLVKKLIMRSGDGTEISKVLITVGEESCTIVTPSGEVVGETKAVFRFCCCCVLKPTYTLESPTGDPLLILHGRISCKNNYLRIKIKTSNSKDTIGKMEMGRGDSFQTRIDLDNSKISEYQRNLIFALSIGMMNYSYEEMKKKEKPISENISLPD